MDDAGAAVEPAGSAVDRATTRRRVWRPSLQVYVLGLIALFVAVVAPSAGYVQHENVTQVRRSTEAWVELQADLAAADIEKAIEVGQGGVIDLASNPGLPAVFADPAVAAAGCTLTFSRTGPFTSGHIDIVDTAGAVLCSSDPLPAGAPYAGAEWLTTDPTAPGLTGPVADPVTGRQVLVVTAPVGDLGVVATLVDLDEVDKALAVGFRGHLDVSFALVGADGNLLAAATTEGDRIAGTADIAPLGWTVRSSVDEAAALADAHALNRQLTLLLLAGLAVLMSATYLLYRGLARPIRRLSIAVRDASDVEGTPAVALPATGPAEVAALAADFSALRHNVATELAGRRQAEAEAHASEERYRNLFAANPLPMWVYDTATLGFLDVNDAAEAAYGYTRDEFLAMTILDIRPPEDRAALLQSVSTAPPMERSGPWRHLRRDGSLAEVEITSHALEFAGHPARFVMAEDVTERERTTRLLQQTQRMESLGQLAGGIAHDFNNVLAVILNYAAFATEELVPAASEDPVRWGPVLHDVEHIGEAGRRAATLTHQLLSFARGQSVATDAVDLNAVTAQLEDMLRRSLGERIDLRLVLAPGLWTITANTGQLEQLLVNLAVNARDAMPSGGRLLVETSNVDVDEHHHAHGPDVEPGRYVRLRVSDTGTGMDAAARDHAFEPFFTTKDRGTGAGTGLGLATVYGIVSQAGGTIHLYSEPGLGTSFTVLLPASDRPIVDQPEPIGAGHARGDETILLVEDDAELRAVTERILTGAGYRVLSAPDGPAALTIATEMRGQIDLMLSDVVMPEMLGSELALRVHDVDPSVRVLFMSGYAPPLLLDGGSLPVGSALVDKPFSGELLMSKVREVLETCA